MPAVMNVVDGKTMYLFDDPDSLKWWQEATFGNQPYIQPSKKTVTKAPEQDFKRPKSINEHLRTIIGLLESRGMEVMILDQTRADVGLPVVKVIVPGMRHFWARLAPGRLYDVPVQMGELERPIAEEDLNPIAMFL
jgi:ribosomal protein S12 methylthiotransferase accessory factor